MAAAPVKLEISVTLSKLEITFGEAYMSNYLGTVPERGSADFTISFAKSGVSVSPTTITYSLSDSDGTIINALSNVSVLTPNSSGTGIFTTSVTVTLSGTDLSIVNTYNVDRVLTIKAIYGGSETPQNKEVTFAIERLVNVP